MSQLKICSIYDSKAEAWMNPLFFQATGQAIRSFGDAIADGKSDFARHPEDYTLFLLGSFDGQTGKLEVLQAPVALVTGVNLLVSEKE